MLQCKAVGITCCECVFVALSTLHEIRRRHIVICGLSGCTMFFILPYKRHEFRKQIIKHNIFCYLFITFIWIISHYKNNWAMCCCKHTLTFSYRTGCCEILMGLSFFRQIFENFIKKPSVRADGWTDRQTHIHS